jgi:hypothetical protein
MSTVKRRNVPAYFVDVGTSATVSTGGNIDDEKYLSAHGEPSDASSPSTYQLVTFQLATVVVVAAVKISEGISKREVYVAQS